MLSFFQDTLSLFECTKVINLKDYVIFPYPNPDHSKGNPVCLNWYRGFKILTFSRLRSKCAVLLETGEAREVHHLCVLVGYGVDAVCPYMVFEIAQMLNDQGVIRLRSAHYRNCVLSTKYPLDLPNEESKSIF